MFPGTTTYFYYLSAPDNDLPLSSDRPNEPTREEKIRARITELYNNFVSEYGSRNLEGFHAENWSDMHGFLVRVATRDKEALPGEYPPKNPNALIRTLVDEEKVRQTTGFDYFNKYLDPTEEADMQALRAAYAQFVRDYEGKIPTLKHQIGGSVFEPAFSVLVSVQFANLLPAEVSLPNSELTLYRRDTGSPGFRGIQNHLL